MINAVKKKCVKSKAWGEVQLQVNCYYVSVLLMNTVKPVYKQVQLVKLKFTTEYVLYLTESRFVVKS